MRSLEMKKIRYSILSFLSIVLRFIAGIKESDYGDDQSFNNQA